MVVFASRDRFAWGARAGMLALPFVHLAVDGPYRTAAMGALMTIIGMRFGHRSRSAARRQDARAPQP